MKETKLKALIEKKHGSVYKFQLESGLPKGYLYQVVGGEANPTIKFINRLAESLEVPVNEILEALSND